MKLLKAQKELLEDTKSEVIMFVGGFGSGRSTAKALKAKQEHLSMVVNLNEELITHSTTPIFEEFTGFDGKLYNKFKKSSFKVMNIDNDEYSVFVATYNNFNNIKLKYKLIMLDNFDVLDSFQQEKVFFQAIALKPKQLILFVCPTDKRKDVFLKALSKNMTVITASTFDNENLPESCTKTILEKYDIRKCLEGKFE